MQTQLLKSQPVQRNESLGRRRLWLVASLCLAIMAVTAGAIFGAVGLIGAGALVCVLAALWLPNVPAEYARGVLAGAAACVVLVGAGGHSPLPVAYTCMGIAILLLVFALFRARSGRMPQVSVVTVVLVSLYSAILLISTAVTGSTDPLRALLISGVAATAVAVGAQFTSEDFTAFSRILVAFAFVNVFYSIPDLVGSPLPNIYYTVDTVGGRHENVLLPGTTRAQGLVEHPIQCAFVLAAGVLLAATDSTRWNYRLNLGAAIVLTGGIVLTGARSAIIALAISGLVAFVLLAQTNRQRWLAVAMLVASGIFLTTSPLAAAFLEDSTSTLLNSGSFTHRAGSWEVVEPLMSARPWYEQLLGSGVGSVSELYARGVLMRWSPLETFDNQLLTTLATAGLVGLTIVVAAMLASFAGGERRTRVLIVFIAVMFFSFDLLQWIGPTLIFFVILGAAGSLRKTVPITGEQGRILSIGTSSSRHDKNYARFSRVIVR